jgi:hypothetical protein
MGAVWRAGGISSSLVLPLLSLLLRSIVVVELLYAWYLPALHALDVTLVGESWMYGMGGE